MPASLPNSLSAAIRNVVSRHVRIFGQTDTIAEVDDTIGANALVFIDTIHNRIHRGQFFSLDQFNTGLAAAGTIELLVKVTTGAHVRLTAAAGGDARLQLFEGTTVSANGTPLTPVNRNRFSTLAAVTQFYSGPTITADGTSLLDTLLPGGTGGIFSGGGGGETFEEFILAPGNYLVRLTNISGSTQPANVQVDFYEDVYDV